MKKTHLFTFAWGVRGKRMVGNRNAAAFRVWIVRDRMGVRSADVRLRSRGYF